MTALQADREYRNDCL